MPGAGPLGNRAQSPPHMQGTHRQHEHGSWGAGQPIGPRKTWASRGTLWAEGWRGPVRVQRAELGGVGGGARSLGPARNTLHSSEQCAPARNVPEPTPKEGTPAGGRGWSIGVSTPPGHPSRSRTQQAAARREPVLAVQSQSPLPPSGRRLGAVARVGDG